MQENINKLEEILGKKFEDWTDDTIIQMVSSEELLKLFTKEVAVELITTRKNESLSKMLTPIKFGYYYTKTRAALEEELKNLVENKMPVEMFKSNVLHIMHHNNDPISKVLIYLTILNTVKDQDVFTEEDVRKAVNEYKEILLSLDLDQGFELIVDLVDVLFPLREIYFQIHKVDILDQDKEIDGLLTRLDAKTREIVEFMTKQNKELSEENPVEIDGKKE